MIYVAVPFIVCPGTSSSLIQLEEIWQSRQVRYRGLGNHYHRRMIEGVEKVAEETVSKRLPKIDDSLEKFFDAIIPGFLNSGEGS